MTPPSPSDDQSTEALRRQFDQAIKGFAREDRMRIEMAKGLAADLHRRDLWHPQPYLHHLLRVTIRIIEEYEVDNDVEIVIAALLHDSVEDHAFDLTGLPDGLCARQTARQAALRMLATGFGDRVAQLVEDVTNPLEDPSRPWLDQYLGHLQEGLSANPAARIIKFSDFTDNTVGLESAPEHKKRWWATKYQAAIGVFRALPGQAPLLSPQVRDGIERHFALTDERCTKILNA